MIPDLRNWFIASGCRSDPASFSLLEAGAVRGSQASHKNGSGELLRIGSISNDQELQTVPLIREDSWEVETHPAGIFALIFIRRWSRLRIARVADPVEIEICLIRIRCERTVVDSVGYSVVIVIRIARVADAIVVGVELVGVRRHRTIVLRI